MKKINLTRILFNIALIAMGLMMIFAPHTGLKDLFILFGILLIVCGGFLILQHYIGLKAQSSPNNNHVFPIILIVAGVLLLIFSGIMATIIIPLVIGIWIIFTGTANLFTAMSLKPMRAAGWWVPLVFSVVYLAVGVVVILNLVQTGSVVSVLLGVLMLILGIIGLADAITVRNLSKWLND
ncbi:MAG: DUF308 domain-containing protein [Christensenellales bacterium]|jgi:uncharacterized membrane protein HdeD (DUF308 family)